jgi:hypothetical protein
MARTLWRLFEATSLCEYELRFRPRKGRAHAKRTRCPISLRGILLDVRDRRNRQFEMPARIDQTLCALVRFNPGGRSRRDRKALERF